MNPIVKSPPKHILDQPELSSLERFPEFRKRLPVDRDFRDVAKSGPFEGLPVGPQARAHLGILEYVRGDMELVSYERTPWQTLRSDYRKMLMRHPIRRTANITSGETLNVLDDANVNRSLVLGVAGAQTNAWTNYGGSDNAQTRLNYGSNGTAPTGAEINCLAVLSSIVASSVAYDDATFRTLVSGSRVHSEADNTIREIAQLVRLTESASSSARFFCIDRAVPVEKAVLSGQTVALTYDWQF